MICLPEFKNITAVTSAAAQHIDLLTGGMDLMSMSSPNVEPNTTSPTSSSSSSSTITNAPGIDNLLRISHGGGSFRFWAWASTQYRTLGEIIESALSKRALQVPYPPLGSAATPSAAVSILNTISNTGMNVISGGDVPIAVFGPYSAVNPAIMIQHPGFFFLTAARCTEQRWVRYRQSKQVRHLCLIGWYSEGEGSIFTFFCHIESRCYE